MRKLMTVTLGIFALNLGGCVIHPYEMQIQQGKVITAESLAKVTPGMSEDQVKYVLGSPDIIDPYHPDSWYYVYTNQQNHLPMAENQLIVHFSNGKVDSISGDYAPPSRLEYSSQRSD